MQPPRGSVDTAQAPKDAISRADQETPPPPRNNQLNEIAREHLEDALDEDTPSEKNYQIRKALQTVVIGIEIYPD